MKKTSENSHVLSSILGEDLGVVKNKEESSPNNYQDDVKTEINEASYIKVAEAITRGEILCSRVTEFEDLHVLSSILREYLG